MTGMAAPANLHAPLELPCGVVLPNRVAKAAMSEQLADRHAHCRRSWRCTSDGPQAVPACSSTQPG